MFGCIIGVWELTCKTQLHINNIDILPGPKLGVKDKFSDDSGSTEKGIWQIKDPYGTTFLMNYEDRQKYFEEV